MKFIEYSFNSDKIKFNKSIKTAYSSVSEVTKVIFCLSRDTLLSFFSTSFKKSWIFIFCSGFDAILISGGFWITFIIDSIIFGIKSLCSSLTFGKILDHESSK